MAIDKKPAHIELKSKVATDGDQSLFDRYKKVAVSEVASGESMDKTVVRDDSKRVAATSVEKIDLKTPEKRYIEKVQLRTPVGSARVSNEEARMDSSEYVKVSEGESLKTGEGTTEVAEVAAKDSGVSTKVRGDLDDLESFADDLESFADDFDYDQDMVDVQVDDGETVELNHYDVLPMVSRVGSFNEILKPLQSVEVSVIDSIEDKGSNTATVRVTRSVIPEMADAIELTRQHLIETNKNLIDDEDLKQILQEGSNFKYSGTATAQLSGIKVNEELKSLSIKSPDEVVETASVLHHRSDRPRKEASIAADDLGHIVAVGKQEIQYMKDSHHRALHTNHEYSHGPHKHVDNHFWHHESVSGSEVVHARHLSYMVKVLARAALILACILALLVVVSSTDVNSRNRDFKALFQTADVNYEEAMRDKNLSDIVMEAVRNEFVSYGVRTMSVPMMEEEDDTEASVFISHGVSVQVDISADKVVEEDIEAAIESVMSETDKVNEDALSQEVGEQGSSTEPGQSYGQVVDQLYEIEVKYSFSDEPQSSLVETPSGIEVTVGQGGLITDLPEFQTSDKEYGKTESFKTESSKTVKWSTVEKNLKVGSVVGKLSIDRLGLKNQIVRYGWQDEINAGICHYALCDEPGSKGVTLLCAHNYNPNWRIDKLRVGDRITYETNWGTYEYVVYDASVCYEGAAGYWMNGNYYRANKTDMVFMTCWPMNSDGKDGVRYNVFAKLVSGPKISGRPTTERELYNSHEETLK